MTINDCFKEWSRSAFTSVARIQQPHDSTRWKLDSTEDQLENVDQHAAILTVKPTTAVVTSPVYHQQP